MAPWSPCPPDIDTGMGLERLAAVKQGVWSNFDTDLFKPLIQIASSKAGLAYGKDEARDLSMCVIAEHARACAFLIADGVQPSNEGRGYVLRRILRRALRHGRLLGHPGPVLEPRPWTRWPPSWAGPTRTWRSAQGR